MSNCGYSSSCPEPVNVTINNQIIQIDDAPAMNRVDSFNFGDVADNRTFALSFFPYEPRSVQVYLNSGAQRYETDYRVQGQYVILNNALVSGDQIFVRYLSVDGYVSSQTSTVGMLVSFSPGTGAIDGFLAMDGTTSYLWSNYPTLQSWFNDPTNGAARKNDLLQSYTGSNFVLRELYDTSYDGTNLVTLNKYISLGASAP